MSNKKKTDAELKKRVEELEATLLERHIAKQNLLAMRNSRLTKKRKKFLEAVNEFAKNHDSTGFVELSKEIFYIMIEKKSIVFGLFSNFIVCYIFDFDVNIEASGISRRSEADVFDAKLGVGYAYSRAKRALNRKINGDSSIPKGKSWMFVS